MVDMELTAETMIDFYERSKPRIILEVDKDTLAKLRRVHDANGTYLWMPEPNYEKMPGKFMGVEISIAKDPCLQYRYIFSDGSSCVAKFDAQPSVPNST